MRLILGSNSKRRIEILKGFDLDFTQKSSGYDESGHDKNQSAQSYCISLAKKKGKAFSNPKDKSVILTADTIVELNGQIIEKPQNVQDNRETLKKLSGTTHNVHTALCLKKDDVFYSGSQKTLVTFHGLSDHNIEQYIETFNPFDKAGGYSIQDGCGILVKHIEGCYFNVLGMPITLLRQMLSKIQLDLWDFLKKS